MREQQGISAKTLRALLLGLLADSLADLRRYKDLEIERVDREGGRIFLKDGRVFRVEVEGEASLRGRRGPGRRF